MGRKVIIDTGCLYRIGNDKEVLDLIKKAGFSSFDYTLFWKGVTEHIGVGDDYLIKATELRKYADSLNLECHQCHAYFTFGNDIETMNRRYEYIKKEMRIAKVLGSKSIVLHPVVENSFIENVEFVKEFIPLAHELDIIIAVENVFRIVDGKYQKTCTSTPIEFKKFLDTINDDSVKACLDLGHAEIEELGTSAVDMIKTLKDHIYCLHIHDNSHYNDCHQVPYTHKINFNKILRTLKEYNYKGNITFEVETCYNRGEEPDSSLPLELYIPFMKLEKEIGDYFVKILDN